MATISIEREIKLSQEASEKLIEIINKPSVYEEKKPTCNIMNEIEEGNKILKQLL